MARGKIPRMRFSPPASGEFVVSDNQNGFIDFFQNLIHGTPTKRRNMMYTDGRSA